MQIDRLVGQKYQQCSSVISCDDGVFGRHAGTSTYFKVKGDLVQTAMNEICRPSGGRQVPGMVHVLGTPQKIGRNAAFLYLHGPEPSVDDFVVTDAVVFSGPGYSVEDTMQQLGRMTGERSYACFIAAECISSHLLNRIALLLVPRRQHPGTAASEAGPHRHVRAPQDHGSDHAGLPGGSAALPRLL